MIASRNRSRGRMKPYVPATFVLCIGAVALIWFLVGLPVEIERVRISGLNAVSEAQLRRIANIELGIKVGRVRAKEIEKALLKNPLILDASVDAGVTGTLHIRIRERAPVAWLENSSCAVGVDGVLLTDIKKAEEGWLRLAGLRVEKGRVGDVGAIQEAAQAEEILRNSGEFPSGTWACRAGYADSWIWYTQGKIVRFSRPVPEKEINRLQRFKRLCPQAWARARALDMRFADRVVVNR